MNWVAIAGFVVLGCACASTTELPTSDGGPEAGSDARADGAPDAAIDTSVPPGPCEELPPTGSLRRLDGWEYTSAYRALVGTDPPRALTETAFDLSGSARAPGVGATDVEAIYQNAVAARALGATLAAGCDPAFDARACAADVLRRVAPRVLRRPLSDDELEARLALYDATTDDGLGAIVEALFLSPSFVFHVELGRDEEAGRGDPVRLAGHEIASRLSFALTGAPPSAALLDRGVRGDLGSPRARGDVVRAAIASGEATSGVQRFHRLWLGYDVPGVDDPDLAASLVGETDAFVNHVIFEDGGRLETLLNAPYTFLDARAAAHYGLPGPASGFTRVPLDGDRYSSLLTHASVLSRFRTISTRGMWAITRLACQAVPSEPPGTEPPEPPMGTTEREILEASVANPACNACHRFFDPVGHAFLGFDREGRPRDEEAGRPIDDTGSWSDAPVVGAAELGARIAADPSVEACVVERAMTYVLGRGIERDGGDRCAFDASLDAFRTSGADIRTLLTAFAETDGFVLRAALPERGPEPPFAGSTPINQVYNEVRALGISVDPEERALLDQYFEGLREVEARLDLGP
jgi:hypothetical protein